MTVTINGDKVTLPEGALLADAVKAAGMELNTVAVRVNDRQPMYAEYTTLPLNDGDKIKLYYMCIGG